MIETSFRTASVIWMVMREGLVLTAVGVIAGLPTAYFGARVLGTLTYGVSPGRSADLRDGGARVRVARRGRRHRPCAAGGAYGSGNRITSGVVREL